MWEESGVWTWCTVRSLTSPTVALELAGGLCHLGVGPSVEGSADEGSSIHQLRQVHPLRGRNISVVPFDMNVT